MNNRERIFKYLSGLMKPEEKNDFENKLRSNHLLKEEFDKIQNKIDALGELNNINIGGRYFSTLIPKVRIKLDKRNKPYSPVLSFAVSVTAVIVLLFTLQLPQTNSSSNMFNFDFGSFWTTLDSSEIYRALENNFINDYAYYQQGSYNDSLFINSDEITYADLESEGNNEEYYFNHSVTEMIRDLSNEEIDELYQNLLNKKIL